MTLPLTLLRVLCFLFLIFSASLFISVSAFASTRLKAEDFSQLPDVGNLALSPSGKKLASTVRVSVGDTQGVAVQVMDLGTKKSKMVLFSDNSKFFFKWIEWKDDTTLMASVFTPAERDAWINMQSVRFKTRDHELMLINTETDTVTQPVTSKFLKRYKITPSVRDWVVDALYDDPEHILMAFPGSDNGFMRDTVVYKINVKTRKATVYHQSKANINTWMTDQQHHVRVGTFTKDDEISTLVYDLDTKKWKSYWPYKIFSSDQVDPLGFGKNPNELYVRAYHQSRQAIFKVNLKDPELKRELVLADPNYDVKGHLVYSPINGDVIGVSAMADGGTHFFDKQMQSLQAKINKAIPGHRNYIYSMTGDLRYFLVFSSSSTDSGTYYLGQTNPVKLDAIAYSYKKLLPELMSTTQKFQYNARDGLMIEAFLTLPKTGEQKNLPTLIFPHGGPIARDSETFDYWTQFFTNKGYAVLRMNFRGSDGQGIEFRNAGLKNWGKEMQDDVEDGARKLIADGIADPNAIGIVGASYGGYAALMGVVKTPDFYRCAISVNGVANVFDLVKDNRAFWRGYNVVDEQIGNDNSNLRAISPVNFADKIKAPVLLVHGTDDRQVDIKHSYQMRDALQKAKKEVTFVELPSEDHYLMNEKNRMDTFKAMDSFLDRCMPVKTNNNLAVN
jgi:dipeptidyl aminopeptidase/acylaminoacyl peptidase